METFSAELLVDCKNFLGEGTYWDAATQKLYWIDIAPKGKIWCCNEDGSQVQSWDVPEMISYAVMRPNGKLLVAAHSGLREFDPVTGDYQPLKQLEPLLPLTVATTPVAIYKAVY